MAGMKENKSAMQIGIYLVLVLGSCYLLFFIALFSGKGNNNPVYQVIHKG